MRAAVDGRRHMIVLSRDEEVISSLTKYCIENNIFAASFQGLGAVERVEIGYYDLKKREYFFHAEDGEFEVASMNGNVALVDGKPFIHAHAVLTSCDSGGRALGAHIKHAHVAVTLEIFLIALDMKLSREYDDETGLKLLQL